VAGSALTDLEYEILDCVVDSDETTRIILWDMSNPANADAFSIDAKRLDFDGLNRVFERLADLGLVARKEEATDGFEHPRRGVRYTWWSVTEEGRRVWQAWARDTP
jgi:hypothetical protein